VVLPHPRKGKLQYKARCAWKTLALSLKQAGIRQLIMQR